MSARHDLRRDEQPSHAREVAPAADSRVVLAHGVGQIDARGPQRRPGRERHSGEHAGDGERDDERRSQRKVEAERKRRQQGDLGELHARPGIDAEGERGAGETDERAFNRVPSDDRGAA